MRAAGLRKTIERELGDAAHDPAEAPLPPYVPDTPETRRDRAQYADVITLMDREVGDLLARLEEDGLADDTVVVFWGDHGVGLPRGKRTLYDSGLRVPLIVRWPGRVRPGSRNTELVSFVDFAPSTLAMCGVTPPDHMQGNTLFGPDRGEPRRYVFAHRDRMDETYDLIRACRDTRYKYLRNFRPDVSRGARLTYRDRGNTARAMRREFAAGNLAGPQLQWFEPTKPVEELYDTRTDPHEVNNVADDPGHAEILERMREDLEAWQVEVGDTGLVPEAVLAVEMRPDGKTLRTAAPSILVESDEAGRFFVTLRCETPGASIVYGLGDEAATKRLYSMPITVDAGTTVRALACRLGYRDSPVTKEELE